MNNKFNLIIIIIIIKNFFLFTYAHSSNFAYIDFEFLIKNSDAGSLIKKKIDKLKEEKKNELNELRTNLIKKENDLSGKKNILSEENFNKELENLKNEISQFNKKEKEFNNFIRNEYEKLNQKLISLIEPILVDYTKKNNIQMLFSKKNLVIADNSLDITEIFMTIINNEVKFDE